MFLELGRNFFLAVYEGGKFTVEMETLQPLFVLAMRLHNVVLETIYNTK